MPVPNSAARRPVTPSPSPSPVNCSESLQVKPDASPAAAVGQPVEGELREAKPFGKRGLTLTWPSLGRA